MTNALRPSELFTLKWRYFDAGSCAMSVSETVYKGNIRPLGKTKKSLSVIHIPPTLTKDLRAWKAECPDSSPEAFIFANQAGNFMDTDNFRKRSPQNRSRPETAEADISGHSPNDRNACAEEGHSEER